jgi:hypothetical protein
MSVEVERPRFLDAASSDLIEQRRVVTLLACQALNSTAMTHFW